MLRALRTASFALILASALAASGCTILAPQPDLTRYYVLAALAEPPAQLDSDLRIGIGPLIVPDYLRRYELVDRSSQTELHYSDQDRWAEPLADGLGRTLAENIALLAGTKRVIVIPAPLRGEPDITVPIEVIRFEPGPDGAINFVARWAVRPSGSTVPPEVRLSQHRVQPARNDWSARTEAMSRAVLMLSEEITAALRAVEQP